MPFSYLIGGKTLEGVTLIEEEEDAVSNFSPSPESSISASSSTMGNSQQQQQPLMLRRLGLSTDEFRVSLLKARNQQQHWLALDASRNQIAGVPAAISSYIYLTQLILTSNSISVLPEALFQLGRLQQLYLSENQIEHIPETMPFHLTELVVLNLDSNRIKVLPESVGHWKKLREFRLGSEYGGNLIEHLPDTVSEMESLTELDMSFNDLEAVRGSLQGLVNLRYLNLSHNRIKHIAVDALAGCSQLDTLDLSDNLLTRIPATAAMGQLIHRGRLQLLNLSNNQLCIVANEWLDQTQTQVIIQGNPLTSQHNEMVMEGSNVLRENNQHAAETLRDMIQSSIPMLDYQHQPSSCMQDMQTLHYDHSYLLHSLREITLRALMANGSQFILSDIPEHISSEIKDHLQLCYHCKNPFVHEWISTAQLKTYQAHRSVAREVRFCTTACLKNHRYHLQQQALASQSQVHLRQQRQHALDFIAEHGGVLELGSSQWAVAASIAAAAQEEQADLLANMAMMI